MATLQETSDGEQLLTIKEAADRLRIPYFMIQRAARQGLIPTYSLFNSRKYVKLADINQAMSTKLKPRKTSSTESKQRAERPRERLRLAKRNMKMTTNFATLAPLYWAAGYSAIPLITGTKKPAISKWTGFCNNLPSEETQRAWLETHADAGIGLPLGREAWPGWTIAAIDIDVDALSRVPEAIIGNAPCKKRGKKGLTVFVKVCAGSKIKSGKIGKEAEEPAGDMLYKVLPPSTHPDTGAPYEWIGKELLECTFEDFSEFEVKHLVWLNLVANAAETQVLAGTHEVARDLVWQLVRARCDEGTVERVILSLLPIGYAGNTLKELPGLISSAKEKLGNLDSTIACKLT